MADQESELTDTRSEAFYTQREADMAHGNSANLPPVLTSPECSVLSPPPPAPTPWKPTFRVYAIVVGLGVANLLAALENTVLTIAAPVILADLELGDNFVWIINAFFLCR